MAFPVAGYMTNAARTEGEFKAALEDFLASTKQLPGGTLQTTLTIASGSVTPTNALHKIDTEGAAASDDLTNIVTTNTPDGSLLIIHSVSAARVVVVKNNAGGAGQIALRTAADRSLTNPEDYLLLLRDGTDWKEIKLILPADTTHPGIVEIATTAEAQAGASSSVVVTPLGLASSARYQGKETVWIPAAAMKSAATNGASDATLAVGSIEVDVKDFDQTTSEAVFFSVKFPKSWNAGTITYDYTWTHSAGSGFVVRMGLAALGASNDDILTGALGTEVTVDDTGGTNSDNYTSPESTAVTIAGSPAKGDTVYFKLQRKVGIGSNLTADARLIGISLYFTTDAKNDA